MKYTYDNLDELKTAVGKEANGTTPRWQEQLGYTYDGAGNLNNRTNNTLLEQFNVNSLNELTTVTNGGRLTVSGSSTMPATSVTVNTSNALLYADVSFASTNQPWAYGANTYTAIAVDAHARHSTNSVTISLAGTNSYSYDLNGNLLTDGTRNFGYDDENELIAVWQTSGWSNNFAYDGKLRRRIERDYSWAGSSGWQLTNEIHFIYDGNVVVQERSAANLPQVSYTRGKDLSRSLQGAGGIGGLLARTDNTKLISGDPLATAYYHCDGNGNVTCLMSPYQQVAAKYLYDPYGTTLAMYGALAAANTYRFSSKEWNGNSGLYYYLYRFYDPNLQRWPNRDPLADFGSLVFSIARTETQVEPPSSFRIAAAMQVVQDPVETFAKVNLLPSLFVANNPVGYADPKGLDWIDCMAICVSGKDPLNAVATVCLTALGGTFPYPGKPGTPLTTVPSRLSLGSGTTMNGNWVRSVGRFFSPLWVGYGLYLAGVEAACAGTCTGNPNAY